MRKRIVAGRRSVSRFLGVFSAAAFVLNWLWEMVQMSAYVELAERSWSDAAITCTLATVGDVALSLGIYAVAALSAGRLRWGMSGGWKVYAAAAVLGAAAATAVEWWALATDRWTYNATMPTVPLVRVGLWPFLQLTLLVPLSLWFARRARGHASDASFSARA